MSVTLLRWSLHFPRTKTRPLILERTSEASQLSWHEFKVLEYWRHKFWYGCPRRGWDALVVQPGTVRREALDRHPRDLHS